MSRTGKPYVGAAKIRARGANSDVTVPPVMPLASKTDATMPAVPKASRARRLKVSSPDAYLAVPLTSRSHVRLHGNAGCHATAVAQGRGSRTACVEAALRRVRTTGGAVAVAKAPSWTRLCVGAERCSAVASVPWDVEEIACCSGGPRARARRYVTGFEGNGNGALVRPWTVRDVHEIGH
jgi:hypothetical protein